jgi:hypothetical protein
VYLGKAPYNPFQPAGPPGENTSSAPPQHKRDETQNESETTRYGLVPVLPAAGAHQPRSARLTFHSTFSPT